ncbi:hypothetical protein TNIN_376661 [Trichonephila inaurata madagascariensis]|uniref:C2H2-type domain-containing protein n=1 Tax=Trichonephila inaurata madagascariensis TaxID=2747483 RepID=A0A8X6XP63_9ARAC|nr:hypothetical protein TNIN_376661 [Trichonephila inaurata madagascariensis]
MDDKCNKPSAINTELQGIVQEEAVDLSTGGDCRKACDSALGMNSQHNDLRSENFDSRSEDLIFSGISLFEPKAKFSALQSDHLDASVHKNSESKSESIELRKQNLKLVSGLKYHRKNTKEKTVQCGVCEKKLSSKRTLTKHLHLHTGTHPYRCSVCGKGFSQSSDIKQHMNTHTGEKPFHCNMCQKRFTQSSNLNKHMKTHTGEKPFHYNMCQKRFTQSSDLIVHMRTHTGEKPFHCNMCQKCFSKSSNLTVHIRTHTKEKPFQCPLCKKKFSQINNLKRHIRTHNG